MISGFLHILQGGVGVMRANSKLVLVGILVFVFPLLFLWVTQNFFNTADHNIDTAEKQRVSLLHDSLAAILINSTEPIPVIEKLINKFILENPDITKIRLVEKDVTGFKIIYSQEPTLIGTYEKSDQLYRSLPLSGSEDSFIYETYINNVRTWQAFRSVQMSDRELFIFSEHSFRLVDSVMAARKQQSYLALSVIFVFLIILAFWLNRQVHWHNEYKKLTDRLDKQDMFTKMIAHEFRSPLTAIKGYASLLADSKNLSTDEVRFANNITGSAHRLVALVSDFLEVARLQAGAISIEKKLVDINPILTKVVNELETLASKKGLALKYLTTDIPVMLNTDANRLTQVLNNLVSNAIKYTDEGTIEIEASNQAREVVIVIKDTGTGISAEDQQKLFSQFTRVGGVDKTSISGTGLGMWITKELVTLLGGSIGVESIKNIGTHVVIVFKA